MNRWGLMLAALPATAQRVLCRANRVSLPRQCPPDERIARLRAALCRATAVRAGYLTLDPDQRHALHTTATPFAGIRLDEAIRRYGSLRSWRDLAADIRPQSVLETLVLRGWVLVRPATRYHPARVLVPPEVRRLLPTPLPTTPAATPVPPTLPPALLVAYALLTIADRAPVPLTAHGSLAPSALRYLRIAGGTTVPAQPSRLLRFVLPVLQEAGLVAFHQGRVSITPAALPWLALPPEQQQERLIHAWQRQSPQDTGLGLERAAVRGMDWPLFRRRLLLWARTVPVGHILPADSYLLMERYLGPLADAHTHGFRTVRRRPWGLKLAERVWQAALAGPLGWLGVLIPLDDGDVLRPAALPEGPGWQYSDEIGVIEAPISASPHDAVLLARYGRRDGETITLTQASIAEAAARGHGADTLWQVLERQAGPLPTDWNGLHANAPAVRIAPAVVLHTDAPALLEQVGRVRSVRRAIQQRLAPTAALVAADEVGVVERALRRRGVACVVEETAEPVAAASLSPGECAALLSATAAGTLPQSLERRLWATLTPALREVVRRRWQAVEPVPAPRPTPPPSTAPAARTWEMGDVRAVLEAAAARGAALRLQYVNAQGEGGWRTVVPLRLWSEDERDYVQAWCSQNNSERTFRVDRIAAWQWAERAERPWSDAAYVIHTK